VRGQHKLLDTASQVCQQRPAVLLPHLQLAICRLLQKHPGALPLRWRKDKSRAPLQVCRHAACAGRSQLLCLFEETIQGQNIPTEPEKRCKFGGPVREGKRPVKDEPDRPPKELPLLRTKLLSRDGNSSLSSDVNR